MKLRSLMGCAAVVGLAGTLGCTPPNTSAPEPVVYDPSMPQQAALFGYAWDIEAYQLLFINCLNSGNPYCTPFFFPGNKLFVHAMLSGNSVNIVDGADGASVSPTTQSDATGMWTLTKTPSRTGAPYFYPRTVGGQLADPVPDTDPLYPGPAVNYVRTVTLRPVETGDYGSCQQVQAEPLSDSGYLEAIAKAMTAITGTPTTVNNLLDPNLYGGVIVVWMIPPGDPVVRTLVPEDGTTLQSSDGIVLNMSWAPPGALPPEFQSARGFYVDPDATASDLGLVAVVLPPEAAGKPVTLTPVDTVNDPDNGRPIVTAPIETLAFSGVATFGTYAMNPVTEEPPAGERTPPSSPNDQDFCYPGY